ncbi:restriction endonuclease subunit S [Vibrio parahaemolyticus]|uniref:restriction endonuclease subunit S n=2 Tax=Vibrio parahaemolyticus TaxID=670 RepID=UPI0006C33013|nr:restriction endonuclease subunit S [Vibrio parahaemolyticus]KON53773.1 restriction endonuclease subunit S [Vibrio parahaemolyticus]MCS0032114.1 restriction endonuclease subunit S [Vibrio parahaemolyticus]
MVPNGWQKQQISDICTLQNGNSFKPHQWDTKGLPIIRIQNLNGSNNFNYYSGEVKEKWLVETGQLLFSWAGTKGVSFGPFIWKKERGVLNQHIYKVYAEEHVDQDWLYESLRWVTNKIEAQAHGFKATLLHVQKKDIDNQPILLPPLPEQRKIAKILSTWDKAIATTEKLIETSKQQKKALMQQLLTGKKRLVNPETGKAFEGEWEEVKLETVAGKIFGGGTPSRGVPEYWNGSIPWVTVKDLISSVIHGAKEHITEQGLSNSSANVVPEGTVIIATRMAVGKAVVATCDVAINQDLKAVSPSDALNSIFLHYWFMWKSTVIEGMGTGSTVKGVQINSIKAMKILLPNIFEQQKISSVLTATDKEIELLEAKLMYFKQEKKALMQQLLTGKRRVKVDEMEVA